MKINRIAGRIFFIGIECKTDNLVVVRSITRKNTKKNGTRIIRIIMIFADKKSEISWNARFNEDQDFRRFITTAE